MDKFGRNYELTVILNDKTPLIVAPPFTLEFDVNRTTLSGANAASFRIYNLSKDHRTQIRFDQINNGFFRRVTLKAGYGNNLSTVFDGNMTQAWSVREGVDFVTQIECLDAGFAFASEKGHFSGGPYPEGTPYNSILLDVVKSLTDAHIQVGAVGDFPGSIKKGNSYNDHFSKVLRDLVGDQSFFIDHGKIYIIPEKDYVKTGGVPIISSETGLLGTPLLEISLLSLEMLFYPYVNMGQAVNLQSKTTTSDFNGLRKVLGISHKGMISPTVCGNATTRLELSYGISKDNGLIAS